MKWTFLLCFLTIQSASAAIAEDMKYCAADLIYDDNNSVRLFYCLGSIGTTCNPCEEAYCWGDYSTVCPEDCRTGCSLLLAQEAVPAAKVKEGGPSQINDCVPRVVGESDVLHLSILNDPKRPLTDFIPEKLDTPSPWTPRAGVEVKESYKVKLKIEKPTGDLTFYANLYHAAFRGRDSGNPVYKDVTRRATYGVQTLPPDRADEAEYIAISVGEDAIKSKYSLVVPHDGLKFVVCTKRPLQ